MFTVQTDFSTSLKGSIATLTINTDDEIIEFKVEVMTDDDPWVWVDIVDSFERLRELLEDPEGIDVMEDCMYQLAGWCRNENLREIALKLIKLMTDEYL